MELLQLKYFCDAAESENFSKTAKKFMIPPSAVSQTVKRLESELKTNLFDREANKIILNASGKLFYSNVKKALTLIDDSVAALMDSSDDMSGEISVLALTNRGQVTEAIRCFKSVYPNITFRLDHKLTSISYDDYDVIVSDELSISAGYEKKLIVNEAILLAVESSHRLARKDSIDAEDLMGESFISMHEESRLYQTLRHVCDDMGFSPNITIRTDDPHYVRKYVEMKLGITLVPELSWKGMFSDDIILKTIGDYRRKTYAFLKKEKYISKATRVFVDTLIECCKKKDS